MKIALVFPACHRSGGVERVIWEAANYLSPRHDVHLIASEASDLPPGVHWEKLKLATDKSPLSLFAFCSAAGRALKALRPDVSVTYGSQCPQGDVLVVGSVHLAWLSMMGPIRKGRFELPGWTRYLSPSHISLFALEHWYFRKPPKALVPCGDDVVGDLEKFFHLKTPNTFVIYNGYDPTSFSAARSAALRSQMRSSLGVQEDCVVMTMVANEWQRKGLGVALDALLPLRQENALLLLVGRQSPDAFTARIEELGLSRVVRYVGPSDDVATYLAASDVFLLPTQYEPFGLVILEALASGLPVITTRLAGASFLIKEGINGFLLDDPLDHASLTALLSKVLDPKLRASLAAEAPASVAGLDWTSLMSQLEEVISKCAA